MRIGLEISPLVMRMSGMPSYVLGLLSGLAEVDTSDEFFLYTNRPIPIKLDLPPNYKICLVNRPIPRAQLWFQLSLPTHMKRDRLDVYHSPWHRLPLRLPVPAVVTIHDLSGYLMPVIHTIQTRLHNFIMPSLLRKSAKIIAVSEFTASEIRRHFPDASGKISVIYEAAPPDYRRVTDESRLDEVRKLYSLPQQYILYLGALEPRKNVIGLLRAFAMVTSNVDQMLVLAGSRSWKYQPIIDLLSQSPLRERVMLAGPVERKDIPAILSMADFLAWPSLYEGFGLPVLESMACGTPVLTSNNSSMSEVAGEAAMLIDPTVVEDIAQGLERLCRDRDLREDLAEKGLRQASRYSWKSTAEQTLDVYRKAARS